MSFIFSFAAWIHSSIRFLKPALSYTIINVKEANEAIKNPHIFWQNSPDFGSCDSILSRTAEALTESPRISTPSLNGLLDVYMVERVSYREETNWKNRLHFSLSLLTHLLQLLHTGEVTLASENAHALTSD